jgi:hypothetical protein
MSQKTIPRYAQESREMQTLMWVIAELEKLGLMFCAGKMKADAKRDVVEMIEHGHKPSRQEIDEVMKKLDNEGMTFYGRPTDFEKLELHPDFGDYGTQLQYRRMTNGSGTRVPISGFH